MEFIRRPTSRYQKNSVIDPQWSVSSRNIPKVTDQIKNQQKDSFTLEPLDNVTCSLAGIAEYRDALYDDDSAKVESLRCLLKLCIESAANLQIILKDATLMNIVFRLLTENSTISNLNVMFHLTALFAVLQRYGGRQSLAQYNASNLSQIVFDIAQFWSSISLDQTEYELVKLRLRVGYNCIMISTRLNDDQNALLEMHWIPIIVRIVDACAMDFNANESILQFLLIAYTSLQLSDHDIDKHRNDLKKLSQTCINLLSKSQSSRTRKGLIGCLYRIVTSKDQDLCKYICGGQKNFLALSSFTSEIDTYAHVLQLAVQYSVSDQISVQSCRVVVNLLLETPSEALNVLAIQIITSQNASTILKMFEQSDDTVHDSTEMHLLRRLISKILTDDRLDLSMHKVLVALVCRDIDQITSIIQLHVYQLCQKTGQLLRSFNIMPGSLLSVLSVLDLSPVQSQMISQIFDQCLNRLRVSSQSQSSTDATSMLSFMVNALKYVKMGYSGMIDTLIDVFIHCDSTRGPVQTLILNAFQQHLLQVNSSVVDISVLQKVTDMCIQSLNDTALSVYAERILDIVQDILASVYADQGGIEQVLKLRDLRFHSRNDDNKRNMVKLIQDIGN
ncbi:hypothetical protein MIR68_003300 [Amoeboaphelidium protococcarum]|nr:hypothetical protein MIR68_003300 [Amoeboaphelidium protococcarum]